MEMDFISEARFGQVITLSTRIGQVSEKTITFEHVVRADGKLACELRVVHIAFDPKTRKAMKVPAHWRASD
jgi:acyl-CoA thioesterase FadM